MISNGHVACLPTDLSIAKTNNSATVTNGLNTTYTIVAANAGPTADPAAVVTDTFPAAVTSASWTCAGAGGGTCNPFGTGNINQTVSLPVGGSVTFTVTATISNSATGSVSNTAAISTGPGIVDSAPGNNISTDGPDTILTQPTVTTVASSVNPSVIGQNVVFTATVTAANGVPNPGTVTFRDGPTTVICNAVPLAAGQATCSISTLSVGTHVITASYSGATNYSPSTGILGQAVNKGNVTVVVNSVNPEPSLVNQAYTVNWSIIVNNPAVGIPTGTFTADDGSGSSCTATLVTNTNTYSCQLISNSAGGKFVKVTYSGDGNFNAAQSVAVVHNVAGNPALGIEGDINIPAANPSAPLGTGDGDVTVADVTVAGRVIRGEVCPKAANPNFQQKFDAGPRNTLGDGLRGGSDVDAIDAYSRHDSTTDSNPSTPAWDATPAGGPATITNLGCTPVDRLEDLSRPAPDADAAIRSVTLIPVDAGDTRQRLVVVDVALESDGTEAGTQFSLTWDASRAALSGISGVNANPDISLGENTPEGTKLNVNAENAGNGSIGIVETFTAMRSENTLNSGTRRIVRLTFHVADGETFSASDIRFADDVVRRETVDSIGMDLDVPGGYGMPAADDKTLSFGRPAAIELSSGK